jgi:protease secretion system membrane fusion protein
VPAPAATPASPLPTDARRLARVGWFLLLGGLGAFLVWAATAPLDQGVPMGGNVTVVGNKKAVQHQSGGTVEAILVKEGDRVTAGQPLVQMNSVQARANADITRTQLLGARSTEARLLAERDGRAGVTFPPDVLVAADQPHTAGAILVQQQLFESRQAALRSELASIDENIAGLQMLQTGQQLALESQQQQLRLLREQVDGLRELAREGFVPRNRLLEMERAQAQMVAAVADATGQIGRNQRQITELRLRQSQRQQDFQKEVRAQLAEVQKEAESLRSRLNGLDHEVASAVVRAPVDGVVADVSIFTVGGVVAPGIRMMDVLPLNEPLIVEGRIPVHLIDSVRPDLPVELIFSAFNQNTTPRVPALVTQVSPDRLEDPKTGETYYRLRADVTPEGRQILIRLDVRPGMPVELFVKTGERTLLSYLFKPLRDNFRLSLTEE